MSHIPNQIHQTWNSALLPEQGGTLHAAFHVATDGMLLEARNAERVALAVTVSRGSLVVEAPEDHIVLDVEDTYGVQFGGVHDLHITFGDFGTRIYLNGYQAFACATNICPSKYAQTGVFHCANEAHIGVERLECFPEAWTSERIQGSVPVPQPDIEFAAAYLADKDVKTLHGVTDGTIYAQFRVRGVGQFGTILAARDDDRQIMNVDIDDDGFVYRAFVKGQWCEYRAHGDWNDGGWHDLVIRAFRGAVDIYVDGNMETHQPGQVFFGDLEGLSYVSIGEDTAGVRLCGEVRGGGLFLYPLGEGQIRKISDVPPTTDTALFDKGYEGSASYRIPSLVTTPSGVTIAGADQRVVISNDAPNEIHFVVRRSLDSGQTWLPLQTVIAFPGDGLDGASVIDSCIVCDRETGRVTVIIDHFPGGRGFANVEKGLGLDARGRLILHDGEGAEYLLQPDGAVTSLDGEATSYRVDEDGNVTRDGESAGNIYLKEGVDPHESLLTARTSYLVEVHSDDDGETWSKPRHINHMVKEGWMGFLGTSPGNGIQLSAGKHRGRLLIPYYCTGTSPKFNAGGALISDDGGQTWRRGKAINEGRVVNGKVVDERDVRDDDATTHESVFVERANGDVLCLFRNQHHLGRVGKAVSHDGGDTWETVEFDPDLPDIFSQPNAVTVPSKAGEEPGCASDRIIFANASLMRPYRGCGVLRLSEDGGRTWARNRCFNPYHYVYQCMSVLPDGAIGLSWERETAGVYFTHLPLSWFGVKSAAEE